MMLTLLVVAIAMTMAGHLGMNLWLYCSIKYPASHFSYQGLAQTVDKAGDEGDHHVLTDDGK